MVARSEPQLLLADDGDGTALSVLTQLLDRMPADDQRATFLNPALAELVDAATATHAEQMAAAAAAAEAVASNVALAHSKAAAARALARCDDPTAAAVAAADVAFPRDGTWEFYQGTRYTIPTMTVHGAATAAGEVRARFSANHFPISSLCVDLTHLIHVVLPDRCRGCTWDRVAPLFEPQVRTTAPEKRSSLGWEVVPLGLLALGVHPFVPLIFLGYGVLPNWVVWRDWLATGVIEI
jgi:hypothetical protein